MALFQIHVKHLVCSLHCSWICKRRVSITSFMSRSLASFTRRFCCALRFHVCCSSASISCSVSASCFLCSSNCSARYCRYLRCSSRSSNYSTGTMLILFINVACFKSFLFTSNTTVTSGCSLTEMRTSRFDTVFGNCFGSYSAWSYSLGSCMILGRFWQQITETVLFSTDPVPRITVASGNHICNVYCNTICTNTAAIFKILF